MDSTDRVKSQIEFYDTIAETYAIQHANVGTLGDLVLEEVQPVDSIVELACGAGRWTEKLCERARMVVAVDSSPNLLKIGQERLSGRSVKQVQADIFSWPKLGRFDTVFFAFWLSHVPEEVFEDFWYYVRTLLSPGARVVFVDSVWSGLGGGGDLRKTPDGREFPIVKVKYTAGELSDRLSRLGFSCRIRNISDNIYMGVVHIPDDE